MSSPCVRVIGAGVSGLSTALCLLERGYRVRVTARERCPGTTSDLPAAFWHPFKFDAGPLTLAWVAVSYRRFVELARRPESGVRLLEGDELSSVEVPDPWWREAVSEGFRRLERHELPPGRKAGWRFTAPIIETPLYMPWLEREVLARGGIVEVGLVRDLEQAAAGADALVVCAGLGARELVPDPGLFGARGQLVWLEPVALERFHLDVADPSAVTYVIPRRDAVVCGGTTEDGVESSAVEPAAIAGILARARALVPALAGAAVLRTGAGIRPCRARVRVERELLPDGRPLLYNYGHGGAGFSASWGAAAAVVALLSP